MIRLRRPLVLACVLAIGAASAAGTLGLAARHLAPAAVAQASPAPAGGRRGNGMAKILMSLNLTDDQKTKIRQISADMRKQNQSVTDPQVRRANYEKMRDQVKGVLTPAQAKIFDQKMAELRAKYQQQQQGGSH